MGIISSRSSDRALLGSQDSSRKKKSFWCAFLAVFLVFVIPCNIFKFHVLKQIDSS